MNQINAARLTTQTESDGLPGSSSWEKAVPVKFWTDWRNENADAERQTEVRMLWCDDLIFVRFQCRFREIFTYEGGNTHRDRLWMRDVAEIFIRPATWDSNHYLEFEISPNGDWLDLDILPGKKSILYCDLKTHVALDREHGNWTAAIAVPVSCFDAPIGPAEEWRLNLFRIEGREPDRFYSAWIPTHTPQPNFHVPELFGILRFLV